MNIMIKRYDMIRPKHGSSRLLTVLISLALLCALLPQARINAQQPSTTAKLSAALQQVLNSNESLVWHDPSRQTVRTLIQANGPVSSALTTAINQAGGSVVRKFTSINGLLADLPKGK